MICTSTQVNCWGLSDSTRSLSRRATLPECEPPTGSPCPAANLATHEPKTFGAFFCFCGQAVEEYVTASASRSDLDRTSVGKGKKKTGTDTGAVAVHPLSGEKVCGATILLLCT